MKTALLLLAMTLPATSLAESNMYVAKTKRTLLKFAVAEQLVENSVDVGTDPALGALGTALNQVQAGEKTVMKWEDSNLPVNVCTSLAILETRAQTLCSRKNYNVNPKSLVIYDRALFFMCRHPNNEAQLFWVRVKC